MDKLNFVTSIDEFKSGMFSTVPVYNDDQEYVLLADGISSNIKIDEYTSSKMVRKGKFTKLIRITKASIPCQIVFTTPCRETTYQFLVTITTDVKVTNPIKYYSNKYVTNASDFIYNRLLNLIRQLTMQFSMFEILKLDDELVNRLLNQEYEDNNNGLTYEVVAVFSRPASDTQESIRNIDNMYKARSITSTAQILSDGIRHKSFEDVIMEEVAKNSITHEEAIRKINEYQKSNFNEKISLLKQLHEDSLLPDVEYEHEVHKLLGIHPQNNEELPNSKDNLLNEVYGDE